MNDDAADTYQPPVNLKWDDVKNEEIAAIKAYRYARDGIANETGKTQDNLIGLAFSGGGIRSATFSLGILEALKEKDLLKKIDYLSTVSGGGYIGSWLTGNCCRHGNQWLNKNADWKNSIAHLRRYSNYLSPQLKLLSADTWSMATIWLRNTLLVQAIIILAIAVLLIFPRQLYWLFGMWTDMDPDSWGTAILFVTGSILISLNLFVFVKRNFINANWPDFTFAQAGMQWLVALFMAVCFGMAATLWHQVRINADSDTLSTLNGCLQFLWSHAFIFLGVLYVSLVFNSNCSIKDNRFYRLIIWLAPIPTTGFILLSLAVIMRIFQSWHGLEEVGNWRAFVWGPTMVLFVFSMAIVVLIGMLGNQSNEHVREWWSRFAAWLAIYGFSWIVIVVATVYGPLWCAWLVKNASWKMLGTGWIGTTLAGIFAGKSVSTGKGDVFEQKDFKVRIKEIIAKIAPFIFITGLLVVIALLLHLGLIFYVGQQGSVETPATTADFILRHWQLLSDQKQQSAAQAAILVCGTGLFLLSWRVDINEFSLNAFYRTRIARCYLGATRTAEERNPHPFTGFDDDDDIKLMNLLIDDKTNPAQKKLKSPLHIINCALNLGGSRDLALHTRHSNNFILTPLHCGSTYEVKNQPHSLREQIGFIRTESYCGENNQPTLGLAVAVSGAAASPNMGYHTSQSVSFLMTLFNARLGWWFPNPLKDKCHQPSPTLCIDYLLHELFGTADEKSKFLAISDGGHFENLAAYELIKRQCKVVIVCDGECDPNLKFEGLAKLVRLCEVDQLAKIDIDVSAIKPDKETGWSQSRAVVGKIYYAGYAKEAHIDQGWLIYIKASMTGHEDTAILQYKANHAEFPHESTSDQFFNEDQFESYRTLGKNIASQIFAKWDAEENIVQVDDLHEPVECKSDITTWKMEKIARNLYDILSPELINHTMFIHQADKLIDLWKQLSEDENLKEFDNSTDNTPVFNFCNQIIQFMENVYLSLNLEETWHADNNKGWMELFKEWARNSHVANVWEKTGHTYGIKFKSFWGRRLS